MKHTLQIIKSSTEPDNKHVLWLHKGILKEFRDNGWEPILGGSIGEIEDDEPLGIPPDNEIWYKTCIKRRVHFGAPTMGSGSSGTSGSSGVGIPEEELLKVLNNSYADKGVITFNKTMTKLVSAQIGFNPYQSFVIDEIALPNSVTTLDSSILDFTNLKSIISNNIEQVNIEDISGFIGTSLWAENQESPIYLNKVLLGCKEDVGEEYKVKEGTKVIARGAFFGQQNLKKVILPNSVQILSSDCFRECSGLTDINIGNCWVQSGALDTTEWFNSNVSIEEPLVIIGKTLYSGYGEDYILKIPEGIKYFNGDNLNLKTFDKIHIPDSIIDFIPMVTLAPKTLFLNTKIPTKNPLTGCGYVGIEYNETIDKLKEQLELETSRWIYDQVYYIECKDGKYWFIDIEVAPKVIYTTSDESLLHIYSHSGYWGNIIAEEYGTTYLKPGSVSLTLRSLENYYGDINKLTSLKIPEGVEYLDHTLRGANNLKTLTIPSSLKLFTDPLGSGINSLDTLIYKASSAVCDGTQGFNISGTLKNLIIEEGVISLPENFIYITTSFPNIIEEIYIPSSVEYIGKHAFGCSGAASGSIGTVVNNVIMESPYSELPTLDHWPWGFKFCNKATLHINFEGLGYVPDELDYSWKSFYRIIDTSGSCTIGKICLYHNDISPIVYHHGWVTTGWRSDLSYETTSFSFKTNYLIDGSVIPPGFMSNYSVDLHIQGNISRICTNAFNSCELKHIYLGRDLTYIEDNAFVECNIGSVYYDGTMEEFRQKVTLEQPIGFTQGINCTDGYISLQ